MINCRTICCMLVACASAIQTSSAQSGTRVYGEVADSASKKGIPFASVSIVKKDSFLLGSAGDANGLFEFANVREGKYKLEVTVTGYVKTIVPFSVGPAKELKLPTIFLKSEDNTLAEVTITQLKALVEDKGDRLIYNAEKDISNSGGTAADLLRKVPMITVDLNGNVMMRGNTNIKVLINGKPSAMMARNLADALRQMPANSIKTVEVITNPGAKYDAEGAAGVINIITKKGLQGLNGSLNATAGNYNRSVGTSFTYRKKKVALNLSANVYQYRNNYSRRVSRSSLIDGVPQDYLDQYSSSDNTGTGANGELSFDYDVDSLNRINFSANIWGGNFPSNSNSNTVLRGKDQNIIQSFSNYSDFRNPFGNGQLDLGYTRTFKKPSQEFSLLAQFSRMPDNYFYNSYFDIEGEGRRTQYSENYSRNKEYTVQADYTHPFKRKGRRDTTNISLEAGSKLIHRKIGSEYYVSNAVGDGPLVEDPLQTNVFDYTQNVYSAYINFRFESNKKWNANTGVRYERTTLDGNFTSTQTAISTAFNNVIPSVSVSKTIKKHTLKASYTQRIRRPMIWNLNPWRNESDPKNVWTGNPYLYPELNHSVELGHSLSGEKSLSLNTSFFLRRTSSGFEYLTTVDSNVAVTRPQNVGKRTYAGMEVNFSIQPNKNWNWSNGVEITHADLQTSTGTLRNSGWISRFNFNTSYKLPHDYTVQANANYYSGWIGLQVDNSPWYWYGVSAKKEFWDKKASVTLNLQNPFASEIKQHARRFDPSFDEYSSFVMVTRSIRLTFEWRFGQMSTEGKKSKKITNDDTGR